MNSTRPRSFDAVLFDWCGTLVEYPLREDRFRLVLERLGRPVDETSIGELVGAYEDAAQRPEAIESDRSCDLSAGHHQATQLLICELAGIDRAFALELDRSLGDLETYPTYPEVVDVISTLAANGVQIAIVSDFHVDLRPHLQALRVAEHIAGFALSCEVGAVKPDPAMFEAALAAVSIPAERCLMVGDNPRPDTGAAALGIATLILPLQRDPRPPLLERVLALALGDSPRTAGA